MLIIRRPSQNLARLANEKMKTKNFKFKLHSEKKNIILISLYLFRSISLLRVPAVAGRPFLSPAALRRVFRVSLADGHRVPQSRHANIENASDIINSTLEFYHPQFNRQQHSPNSLNISSSLRSSRHSLIRAASQSRSAPRCFPSPPSSASPAQPSVGDGALPRQSTPTRSCSSQRQCSRCCCWRYSHSRR